MLLPIACPVCGARGEAPCARCRAELRRAPPLPPPPGVDACHVLLAYDGAGRELVARLKYRNARASLPFLASAMAALVDASDVDVVTWVPTTPARRRARGYDQARLLARRVGARLRVPVRPLLRREPGPAQTGRPRAERLAGPAITASARLSSGTRVLLVDDVVTTGTTIGAAARALHLAGAAQVCALAAARTPLKLRRATVETTGDVAIG